MSSIVEDIAAAHAEVRDALRSVHLGESAKLLLLKTDGGAQVYSVLETVTSGWSARFSDYFGSTTFEVARIDAPFAAKVAEASHVLVIDSDNPTLNNQLHAIDRDTTRPAGADPYWRIRAVSIGKRYTPA